MSAHCKSVHGGAPKSLKLYEQLWVYSGSTLRADYGYIGHCDCLML